MVQAMFPGWRYVDPLKILKNRFPGSPLARLMAHIALAESKFSGGPSRACSIEELRTLHQQRPNFLIEEPGITGAGF